MGKKIIAVAPHPDDETLGCGGTLLKHIDQGDEVHWLIMTEAKSEDGFSLHQIDNRKREIEQVAKLYSLHSTKNLKLPTTKLETIPLRDIVARVAKVFKAIQPEIVYLPYPGDVHSDHKVVFDAVTACTKWFRFPSIKRVLVYETLSETEFGMNPDLNSFRPTVFVNIHAYLDKKLEIINVFESEMGNYPFPRSEEAIRGLAAYRGSSSGCLAAEAFMLIREVID